MRERECITYIVYKKNPRILVAEVMGRKCQTRLGLTKLARRGCPLFFNSPTPSTCIYGSHLNGNILSDRVGGSVKAPPLSLSLSLFFVPMYPYALYAFAILSAVACHPHPLTYFAHWIFHHHTTTQPHTTHNTARRPSVLNYTSCQRNLCARYSPYS